MYWYKSIVIVKIQNAHEEAIPANTDHFLQNIVEEGCHWNQGACLVEAEMFIW